MADRFGRSQRKEKSWLRMIGGTAALTADSTALVTATLFAIPAPPFTIMRMLGEYLITPTAAVTATDEVKITVGIGLFSADAIIAGAASLSDPSGDEDYPWMYWAEHSMRFTAAASPVGLNANVASTLRVPFDIGSMRKVRPARDLGFVVSYSDVLGAPPITFGAAATRLLIAHS